MKLGAHGKWGTKCEGGTEGKREQEFKKKWGGDGSRRELGMEGKREGEGGKVWELADRIGYAQTESQAQAQTWEPFLNLRNASPVSPSSPSLKKTPPSIPLPVCYSSPTLNTEPLLSDSSLSFLFKQANTHIHTSVMLNCCGAIEGILENSGCWPSK